MRSSESWVPKHFAANYEAWHAATGMIFQQLDGCVKCPSHSIICLEAACFSWLLTAGPAGHRLEMSGWTCLGTHISKVSSRCQERPQIPDDAAVILSYNLLCKQVLLGDHQLLEFSPKGLGRSGTFQELVLC